MLVLFPAACRRVRLPLGEAFSRAVWPAVWPAIASAIALAALREYTGDSLWLVVAGGAASSLLYVALFILAVGRQDREQYTERFWELVGGKRGLAPATGL